MTDYKKARYAVLFAAYEVRFGVVYEDDLLTPCEDACRGARIQGFVHGKNKSFGTGKYYL